MESDKGPRLARTVRGQQGWIARATAVGGGLAIMLVLVASAGAGAAAPHRTTLAPPYNATTYSWATSSATGCGSQRTIHPIGFDNSNGLARVAEMTTSKTCHGPAGGASQSSSSTISNALQVYWPITIPSSGSHSVQFNATDSERGALQVWDSGTCSATTSAYYWGSLTYGACSVYAELNFGGAWWTYDATNGTVINGVDGNLSSILTAPFYVESSKVVDWGCYSAAYGGACFSFNSTYKTPARTLSLYSAPFTATYYVNGTFNSSHTYYLVWEGATIVSTEEYGWSAGYADAHLNIAGPGLGVKFNWISVA
jgi:hypothetical protein